MWKVLTSILIIIIILFFVPRLVSAAYGQTAGNTGEPAIRVEAADPSVAPSAEFFGKAIGGVKPGDLFYVDATDSPRDVSVSLYLTNSDELIHYLRYLTLKVAVYVEDGHGRWIKLLLDGSVFPDTYITLQNSPVNFILPGLARYKVTVNSGCYYCLSVGPDGRDMSPQFYLEAEPA